MCRVELPAAAASDLWEYTSGRMRFCSRECMEQKKKLTDAKISEGRKKQKAEPFSLSGFEPVAAGKVMTRDELKAQLTEDLHIKPLAKDIGHEELQPLVIEDEMHNYPDAMAQAMLEMCRKRQPLIKDVRTQVQDDGLLVTGTPTEEMVQMIETINKEEQHMEASETTLEHFDPDMYAATEDVGKTEPQEKEGYRNFQLVLEMQDRIDQLELRNRQLCEDKDAWKDGHDKLQRRCEHLLSTIDTLMDIIKEH